MPDALPAPSFVDVFAGCGGLSLGLKRAGWRGLFAVERDSSAFETLNANFPDGAPLSYNWPADIERKAWDIRELLSERREALESLRGKVDLLAGGPPCQGFSHAGRRRSEDPRNRLFEAYLELVSAIRPSIVLIENVKGFTSDFVSNKGEIKNFSQALKERLDIEYDTTSTILKASDFGVPQARPRFFLVGVRRELRGSEHLSNLFSQMRYRTADFLRSRNLPLAPSSRDAISDLEVGHNGTSVSGETAGFLQINYHAPRTPFQIAMRDGHSGPPGDLRLARHRPEIQERFASIIRSANEEGRLNVSISAEVRRAHGLKKMAIRVLDPLNPAPTITSLPEDLLHYTEPRALTVRENARLQTFPDWFQFKGKYTTGGLRRRTEVPRFTQVANAVPPILAEQLGISLLKLSQSCSQAKLRVNRVAEPA